MTNSLHSPNLIMSLFPFQPGNAFPLHLTVFLQCLNMVCWFLLASLSDEKPAVTWVSLFLKVMHYFSVCFWDSFLALSSQKFNYDVTWGEFSGVHSIWDSLSTLDFHFPVFWALLLWILVHPHLLSSPCEALVIQILSVIVLRSPRLLFSSILFWLGNFYCSSWFYRFYSPSSLLYYQCHSANVLFSSCIFQFYNLH